MGTWKKKRAQHEGIESLVNSLGEALHGSSLEL